MATTTATAGATHEQQQQQQQQQQHQPPLPLRQPAVDKVRTLLYRRLKVVLPSGRVIEGDLACLDKQGNLILTNACEHILTGGQTNSDNNNSSSSGSSDSAVGSHPSNSSSTPQTQQLGMVLVPKSQQQDVRVRVSLAEKASMLSLADCS